MTTPGFTEDPSSNDTSDKQGILSFFQNIKAKEGEDVINLVDSDDERQNNENQEHLSEPNPNPFTQPEVKQESQDERVGDKGKSSSAMKQLKEVVVSPQSTEGKRKQKEEQKQRREELKRQKEVDKQRREELRRQKEVDKQRREEEKLRRESEKKIKEEERMRKENEKKAKEEAKERSQARIGNFFKKVSDSNKTNPVRSDYEKFFLPFYTKEGVVVNQPKQLSYDELVDSKNQIDLSLGQGANDDCILEWLNSGQNSVKTSLPIAYQAVSLLQQMTSKEKSDQELQSLLSLIPQRYIKFYENVRPPYMGTYSKDVTLPIDNPFSTENTGYNYEYDSDLEWVNGEEEEEVEGGVENLESGEEDEDEEEEEASEGEFDGFLDAEDNGNQSGPGKKKFIGPLIPTVCLRKNQDQMEEEDRNYFNMVAVQYLIEEQPFPIDPSQQIKLQKETTKRTATDSQNDSLSSPSVSPEKKNKTLISEPRDLLKLFDEIQDSTFSLGTVTEIAQKSLPLYSKQMIKNTVKEYAIKANWGPTRKWAVKDPQYWEELRSTCNGA